jgi:hypothetical protein
MTEERLPSLREIDGASSPACGCCPKCKATHWITAAIKAQKKLDDLINVNLKQQLEIGALRRHITELTAIIETRSLRRDSERRH